jgi:integrase
MARLVWAQSFQLAHVREQRRSARNSIIVALKTGMRHGDLLALRWQDVDLVAGARHRLSERGPWSYRHAEVSKPREIPMSDEVRSALKGTATFGSFDDHDDDAQRASLAGSCS